MSAAASAYRLGVYGGAFDPPHLAHRALIEIALSQLKLDSLHVVPTGQAWHKPRSLSDATHRLAMCELAFSDLDKVHLDDRETRRNSASFTVDTLRELRQENGQAELFLIIGADQAQAFQTWKSWPEILDLAKVCVAQRPINGSLPTAPVVPQALAVRLHELKMPALDISASDIRMRRASGQSLQGLVCEPVAGYIDKHHLYQSL